ncbi:uncharacterized protein SPSK_07691 [Sporothrix schenckii 1099-18]|uniref:F-box domain-containing protein n=2 Tax=Sporothrix schenckii TaxID=29908 RepID=U7PGX6_SPOS1|nr:uncharacterized protein SPSK_07691 [Sporothrix schenckii 1099-18]ERS94828.1 hypothetical protein HMPREF1624_08725 [Sporothrix schenckii ATCC 58251]KJR89028.1 hypothetical protein SPSK_07691 [Sporothrix schenckii 1099-18]
MVKKTTKKAQVVRPRLSRPVAVSPVATPVFSSFTTPSSSALPSAYVSEDEDDVVPAKFDISTIPIHKLSIGATVPETNGADGSAAAAAPPGSGETPAEGDSKGKEPEYPIQPFRLLDLPSELRVKIYGFHFEGVDAVVDLTPDNYKKVHRKLMLLRTCRTIYREASYYYYSMHTFRIFPTYPGRFFKTRRPLLARLKKEQRNAMTSLELRLGPGFNKPPKCWVVNRKLGLKDCVNVRKLNVFVQLDPSVSWLDGFRKAGFYEAFSRDLLHDILQEAPSVEVVEFDAYESVRKNCPIMEALQETVREHGKRIMWGPRNGWTATSDNAGNMKLNSGGGAGRLIINVNSNGGSSPAIFNYDNPYDTPIISMA